MKQAICTLMILGVIPFNFALPQSPFWEQTNGPYISEIRTLSISAGGSVFAGDIFEGNGLVGGLFRSNDHGETWKRLSITGLATRSIYSVKALSENIVLAIGHDTLFRSTDNGDTWAVSDFGVPHNPTFTSFIEAPNGYVFAGRPNSFSVASVYRSTDLGEHWTNTSAGLPQASFTTLLYADGNLFAGAADVTGGGIYRSSDYGNTWIEADSTLRDKSISCLAIDSVGTLLASSKEWIFRSTDHGNHWTAAESLHAPIYSLMTSPVGTIFAGTWDGLYTSTDNGQSWQFSSLARARITSLVADPANDLLFVGTEITGIFRSTDHGQHWIQVHAGCTRTGVFALTVYNNELFAGAYYAGLYHSTDRGNHWQFDGILLESVRSFAFLPGGKFFALTLSSVYRSIDSGRSWTDLPQSHFYPSAVAVDSDGNIYGGSNNGPARGLYRSTDYGDSWTLYAFPDTAVTSIAVSQNGDIFVGIVNPQYGQGTLVRSTDHCSTWKRINAGIAWVYPEIWSIVFNSNGTVFIGGYPLYDGVSMYRSTDNGDHWTDIGAGLPVPQPPINRLMTTNTGTLYAAIQGRGVYYSTTDGDSWTRINDGLQDSAVYSLALDSSGYLYAGTDLGGLHRSLQPVTGVKDQQSHIPLDFSLCQNYPNPFNPSTSIEFSIPHRSFVTLKVYNLLGEELGTLISRELTAGTYTINWNAPSTFASGVYFYRLQTNSFTQSRKLLLIR